MADETELTALSDPDNVQFHIVEEDELTDTGGFTDDELDALLNTPGSALTAGGAIIDDTTESLYDDPGFIKLSAVAYGSDANLREYWTHGEGGEVKIRWGTPGDFKRCVRHLSKYVRDPEGLCNEYHVGALGKPPGQGHSGETESFTVRTGNAPVRRVGAPPMTTEVAAVNAPIANAVGWKGTLAIEGVETGDGREFSHGSLEWAELPLPLMYQYETSHGGTTDKSTNVGNITEIWRDDNRIMGRGTIDISDKYGLQAARKMKGQYLRGVSIDADSVKAGDVELVFAETAPGTEPDLMAPPDKTIFHRGRVRGATLVNLPAFVEASLELTGDTSTLDMTDEAIVAAGLFGKGKKNKNRDYVRDEKGRFDDVPGGDYRPEDRATKIEMPDGRIRYDYGDDEGEDYEYVGDPESDEGAGIKYIPDPDEEEYEGDPESDEGARVRKKNRQYVSPDHDYSVITAAATTKRRGYTIEIPELPPLDFFQEPKELPPIGAVWIEPNGHIYGLVGPSGVAHRAFKNKRVTIPMGNVDYTAWMNRPTLVEGPNGEVLKIRTGVITMNCGHLNPYASDDAQERMRHYDNSCSIAALVRVGESRAHKAPWVAGTILPMSTGDFLRFQACQLSGDWAPHRERRGWKEFVASLSVPVPGFARSTDVAAVRVDDNSVVVASSVPIHLSEDAYVEDVLVDDSANRTALAWIQQQLGGDRRNRQSLEAIQLRMKGGLTASAATVTPTVKEKKVACAPCAAKRRGAQQTSAQTAVVSVPGIGDGDAEAAAQKSASNAVANTRTSSRG